jgi:hypothetical protein
MKASLKVTAGAVRVYSGADREQWFPHKVEPTHAPYLAELEGEWAVGSASKPPNVENGSFVIEALEPGTLRWFRVSHDTHGNVTSSTDSTVVPMSEGEKKTFTTHDSNAYTVRSDYPEQPEKPE